METSPSGSLHGVRCPICDSEAYYKYGKTRNGKQRFICLVCKRQFSRHSSRHVLSDKPVCPKCGKPMHAYKREKRALRFRCSNYPICRTFMKVSREEDCNGSVHP